jgi:acyl carrier protein
MTMAKEEVFEKVQEVLIEALGVDDDEVESSAKLVEDLGAESIDFLDIVFRLEKSFGIKIDQKELFPEDVLSDPKFVNDGVVTDAAMEELRTRMPHANLDEFDSSRKVEEFSNVFTVDAIVEFVAARLD